MLVSRPKRLLKKVPLSLLSSIASRPKSVNALTATDLTIRQECVRQRPDVGGVSL
jgi:hypothetical protein